MCASFIPHVKRCVWSVSQDLTGSRTLRTNRTSKNKGNNNDSDIKTCARKTARLRLGWDSCYVILKVTKWWHWENVFLHWFSFSFLPNFLPLHLRCTQSLSPSPPLSTIWTMQGALCLVSEIAVTGNQKRWRKKTWPIFELWFESSPPSLHGYFIIFGEGRRCCVCSCVVGGGGILIIVHAWVINQFRRYWKTVDGRCCSEGKTSKRGKYEGGVFWFVPVGSQDFFLKMMLFFFSFLI